MREASISFHHHISQAIRTLPAHVVMLVAKLCLILLQPHGL